MLEADKLSWSGVFAWTRKGLHCRSGLREMSPPSSTACSESLSEGMVLQETKLKVSNTENEPRWRFWRTTSWLLDALCLSCLWASQYNIWEAARHPGP